VPGAGSGPGLCTTRPNVAAAGMVNIPGFRPMEQPYNSPLHGWGAGRSWFPGWLRTQMRRKAGKATVMTKKKTVVAYIV
jgi:hypothetical protein